MTNPCYLAWSKSTAQAATMQNSAKLTEAAAHDKGRVLFRIPRQAANFGSCQSQQTGAAIFTPATFALISSTHSHESRLVPESRLNPGRGPPVHHFT